MEVESSGLLPFELIPPSESASSPGSPRTLEQIYASVYSSYRPRTPLSGIQIEVRRYANASAQIQLAQGVLRVKLADTLSTAPEDIQESLAEILIAKLLRKPVPAECRDRYGRYLNRAHVRKNLDQVRQARGRKYLSNPAGDHHDLRMIFEELNVKYFFGLMAQPTLGWSRGSSRTLLGHYDPCHNAIVISKALDHERIPKLAVEFVLFHEMLHLRHPAEHHGARRCVHTRGFKQAEKQFEQLREAKALLRALF